MRRALPGRLRFRAVIPAAPRKFPVWPWPLLVRVGPPEGGNGWVPAAGVPVAVAQRPDVRFAHRPCYEIPPPSPADRPYEPWPSFPDRQYGPRTSAFAYALLRSRPLPVVREERPLPGPAPRAAGSAGILILLSWGWYPPLTRMGGGAAVRDDSLGCARRMLVCWRE